MLNVADSSPATAPAPLTYERVKKLGRPTSLTPDLIESITALVAEGHYIEVCCAAMGVPKRNYYNWLERGKADAEKDISSPEAEFWHAIKAAEPWGEIEMIRDAKSGKIGWQGPMTVASRRHRERWQDKEGDYGGPRVLVQIGVNGGEVKVGLALSPANINDLACANQGQVEMLSPINSNYVNQPDAAIDSVPAPAESDRGIPAVEPAGGPYPVGRRVGGQRTASPRKGRPTSQKQKRVRVAAQKARETA